MRQPASGTPSRTRRYRIEHRTTYSYSDEVTSSYGRGWLIPRELPSQRCLTHSVTVEPPPSDQSEGADVYGNLSSYFHVTRQHTTLVVTGRSEVEVDAPTPPAAQEVTAPWETARPATNTAGAHADNPVAWPGRRAAALAVEFTLDLAPAEVTPEVTAYAARSFTPGRPLRAAIAELNSRIHADFTYRSGSTTVSTSVAAVFREHEGVCQDFARIACACLRSQGLAARYVSGYLATDPPPGWERMVGADATHAWAAVWLPEDHWLAFDPTNNQFADERYITVAWGRDYADVPPLRGIIYTDAAQSSIAVSVDVAALDEQPR